MLNRGTKNCYYSFKTYIYILNFLWNLYFLWKQTQHTACLFCAIQLACEVPCLMPTFLKLPAKITKLSSSRRVIKM